MNQNILKDVEIVRVKVAVAAGTTDIESDIVDCANCDGVVFLVPFGAITSGAVTSVKAQQNTANSGTGMADLEGTAQTVADDDDDQVCALEIHKPRERYVRCVVDRGTQNAVVDGIIALKYGVRKLPATQGATVVGSATETHASPAEGTA